MRPRECVRKTSQGNRRYPKNIIIVQLDDRDELYNELSSVMEGRKEIIQLHKVGGITLGIEFDNKEE